MRRLARALFLPASFAFGFFVLGPLSIGESPAVAVQLVRRAGRRAGFFWRLGPVCGTLEATYAAGGALRRAGRALESWSNRAAQSLAARSVSRPRGW